MSKKECTNKTILDFALEYFHGGWCVIPIGFQKIPPRGFQLQKYFTMNSTESQVNQWFANKYKKLAVITGRVSGGLTILEFDSMEGYEWWKKGHQELAETLPTVKTSRGMHVYFRSELDKNFNYDKIDLLVQNKYALLPPSLHPDKKSVYKWVIPPNGELPLLDLRKWDLDEYTEETEDMEDTEEIEEIEAISIRGRVRDCIDGIGSSGLSPKDKDLLADMIIKTLPNKESQRNREMFEFCRYLKGLESLRDLPAKSLKPIIQLWHEKALPFIGAKPFAETWADLAHGWKKVKWPKGDDTLEKAVKTAIGSARIPPEAKEYDSEEVRLLIKVCCELQQLRESEPFWLACRSAAGILGVSATQASKFLQMLVVDGVLEVVEGNTTTRGTRYRYLGGTIDEKSNF
ncbi:MAG: bifunctional DNA primase/polymerase [Phycisphaerales bacterium]|nr:MAG: bifunctional DNA primase/polymerase [Phycisphaerales bacterium]